MSRFHIGRFVLLTTMTGLGLGAAAADAQPQPRGTPPAHQSAHGDTTEMHCPGMQGGMGPGMTMGQGGGQMMNWQQMQVDMQALHQEVAKLRQELQKRGNR